MPPKHQTHDLIKMFLWTAPLVTVAWLPDLILRFLPLDESLLQFPGAWILALQQVMRPFINSVAIPVMAVSIDKRYRKGVFEVTEKMVDCLT